jgi:hypothetical protein
VISGLLPQQGPGVDRKYGQRRDHDGASLRDESRQTPVGREGQAGEARYLDVYRGLISHEVRVYVLEIR